MDFTEYDFQSRPHSALNLKGRPESAKSKQQMAQAYGSKKLPSVRPASAVVGKANSKSSYSVENRNKKQTDEEIIEEEQDSNFLNHEKPGIDINALFLNPPSSMPENRKLPKNIKKEKEKLYEEQLELKQQINKLKEEITRLKTKNVQLQKENSKLEKLLENLDSYMQTGQGHQPFSDHLLMNNLKKTVKELKGSLAEREAELNILKKHIKVTRIQELETDLKNYIEESIRLRSLLDQALRNQAAQKMATQLDSFEEKFYVQMKVINSLQQEIDQFNGAMKLKDEELFNATVRCEQFEILKYKAEEQYEQLKQSYSESQQKIETLQTELQNLKSINNNLIIKATKSHNDDLKIMELDEEKQDLMAEIHARSEQILQLERQIQEMKHHEQETFKQLEKERKAMENDMEYYKNQYEIVDEKYKNLLLTNAQAQDDDQQRSDRKSSRSTMRLGTVQIQPTFNHATLKAQIDEIPAAAKQLPPRPQSGVRRRRVVKLEDVKDLGLELNMRFRLRKLKLDDIIEKELFDPVIRQKGVISIKDIAVKLSDEPFELKDVEKMYLLARYLIEDNSQQDWVDFDEEATSSLQTVRSIFKYLIGKCRIFSEEEEKQYRDEIVVQIVKYKKSILSYLPTFQQTQLSKDQLTKAFNYMGIQLSSDAYDYFFLRLFEISGENDAKKFDYRLIIDEWGKDEQQPKPKRQQERSLTKRDQNSQQFVIGSKFTFDKS